MNAIGPTPAMAELMNTVRNLPADLIREVADFAEFLGRKRLELMGPAVDEELTEQDLRNHRVASMRRFDEENGEENWGVDYSGSPSP